MRRSYKGIPINTSANTHEKVFILMPGDRKAVVADIPSGAGAFVKRLNDNGYENVIAMDIEPLLRFEHAQFVQADMTKPLPLAEVSLDALVCIDGIEHIERPFDFVREAARVLRKGGNFIISTPNINSLRSRMKWLLTGHHHKCDAPLDENKPSPLHHINMVSYHELRYMLHTNGFEIELTSTNRIKVVSWFYLPLVPLVYLFTSLAYRRAARRDGTKALNKAVKKNMFSAALLFGETLIVKATKR